MKEIRNLLRAMLLLMVPLLGGLAWAGQSDYLLGAGDVVRINVFQNPDLTVETRISESGEITYPMLGSVQIGNLSIAAAEKRIAKLLNDGGFVKKAQVNLLISQMRGSQFSVLGQVNRPGRFPIEINDLKLADALAVAGGISVNGADTVILAGQREGKPLRIEIDIATMFLNNRPDLNVPILGGDILYVHRAPQVYVYGEVNRPGGFRLERNMTVMQVLALGGSVNQRGSLKKLELHRRGADGSVGKSKPDMTDILQADDVIYVPESLF